MPYTLADTLVGKIKIIKAYLIERKIVLRTIQKKLPK